jgi:probable phosphoglycerate mutase
VSAQRIWLVRHGETEWSASGRHTGTTDIALTARGEEAARALAGRLADVKVQRVLTSPLQRARRTAEIAGFAEGAEVVPDLVEWNYGQYEGITTPEIRKTAPGWTIWSSPTPGGETPEQITARLDRVVDDLLHTDGDVAVFGHGHALRVLAARWVCETADFGRHLVLSTAAVCCLGYERDSPAIVLWNDAATQTP